MGIRISRNWLRRRLKRPTIATFEIGEVLLTTSIGEVLRQLRVAEVPRDPSLPHHFAESHAIHLREFGRLAEGERSLSIERDGEFGPGPLRNLRLGNTEALDHRVRDCQGHPHATTIPRFAGQTPLLWWSSLHAVLDLRVVAATNKNLREAVKEGAFRQDLYFRLNVIQIVLPPMRERPEDILPLARFFIEHYNRKFRRRPPPDSCCSPTIGPATCANCVTPSSAP